MFSSKLNKASLAKIWSLKQNCLESSLFLKLIYLNKISYKNNILN